MTINIWSDIRCPFCYIGKRKFEMALANFEHKDHIEVIWRSFELDPQLKTQTNKNIYEFFAEIKGISLEKAKELNDQVGQIAKDVGLDFKVDDIIVANSFKAHRLIQLGKSKNLGAQVKEALFKAHFSEGKNIDDLVTLAHIGASTGFEVDEVIATLSSVNFAEEVRQEEAQAGRLGIRGVPFFVFDNKYAVSGAQSPEVFLQTLEKSWAEYSRK